LGSDLISLYSPLMNTPDQTITEFWTWFQSHTSELLALEHSDDPNWPVV
jgi:hypothetical protein